MIYVDDSPKVVDSGSIERSRVMRYLFVHVDEISLAMSYFEQTVAPLPPVRTFIPDQMDVVHRC